MQYTSKIRSLVPKVNGRSKKAIKNIIMSFGVKGGGIAVSLLLVPMTIDYISPIQYGVWLTISSIVGWMNFFDIGLGNGLRNKLTEAIANKDLGEAKKYVSTTYAALCLISIILFLLFWIINIFLDWNSILNIPINVSDDMSLVMMIVLSSFCLQFVVQTINTVLTSIHEPAKAAFISFLGQLGILIAVILLKQNVPGTLTILVWTLMLIPIVIFLLASIYLYNGSMRFLSPNLKHIEWKYAKNLMNTGGKFFIIQIGAMLLFQSNNIIITNTLGPEAVTEYNVSYKLFSVVSMVFTIIITPYWSAFTDSYVKKDYDWMKKTMASIRKVWLLLSLSMIVLLLLSEQIFQAWLGSKVQYNLSLSIAMTIYMIVFMWQTLHVYFLNGISKIRFQLIMVIIGSVINIPLTLWMGKIWGLTGIITANTIVFTFMGVILSIQVKYILNNNATGIWAK